MHLVKEKKKKKNNPSRPKLLYISSCPVSKFMPSHYNTIPSIEVTSPRQQIATCCDWPMLKWALLSLSLLSAGRWSKWRPYLQCIMKSHKLQYGLKVFHTNSCHPSIHLLKPIKLFLHLLQLTFPIQSIFLHLQWTSYPVYCLETAWCWITGMHGCELSPLILQ